MSGYIKNIKYINKATLERLNKRKYKIFRKANVKNNTFSFYTHPYDNIMIQCLEICRGKVNEMSRHIKFKSINDIYNYILQDVYFDLTLDMCDLFFSNKMERLNTLDNYVLKQISKALNIEILYLEYHKKKDVIFKKFETTRFGLPTSEKVIIINWMKITNGPGLGEIESCMITNFEKEYLPTYEVFQFHRHSTCIDYKTNDISLFHFDILNICGDSIPNTKIPILDLISSPKSIPLSFGDNKIHIYFYNGRIQRQRSQITTKNQNRELTYISWIGTIGNVDASNAKVILVMRTHHTLFQLFICRSINLLGPTFKIKHHENKYSLMTVKNHARLKNISSTDCPCRKSNPNTYFWQAPIKSPPIPFLLNSLGWLTDNIKAKLDLIVKISVGFFDIECETSKSNGSPKIGIVRDTDIVTLYEMSKQNLQLIGYSDGIDSQLINLVHDNAPLNEVCEKIKENKRHNPHVFHLGNNEKDETITESTPETRTDLVKRFICYIEEQSKQSKYIKKKILQDILDQIEAIAKIYNDFYNASVKSKDPRRIFCKYNVYQQLYNKLFLLIKRFHIFGFNSAKYDVPIILSNLYSIIGKEYTTRQIKCFRKGSKILALTIRFGETEIIFKDYIFLDSPKTSLRVLAKRYNVSEDKGYFPHSVNTSIEYLKKTTYMPTRKQAWTNVFTGGSETIANINIAVNSYNILQCKNLYEYFVYYLKTDVIDLQEIFMKYWQYWRNEEDFDFYISQKFTISSLLFYLVFYNCFHQDFTHLAPFNTKSLFVNRILEESKIGGITNCAAKGLIGKNNFTINSHLLNSDIEKISSKFFGLYKLYQKNMAKGQLDGNEAAIPIEDLKTANHILSYDISSLYASAMLEDLPTGPVIIWDCIHGCPHEYLVSTSDIRFKRVNKSILMTQEYLGLMYYLRHTLLPKLEPNEKVIHIQSGWTIGGQINFAPFANVDLIILTKSSQWINYYVINFDGAVYHGGHQYFCKYYDTNAFVYTSQATNAEKTHRRESFLNQVLYMSPDSELQIRVICKVINSCELNMCNSSTISKYSTDDRSPNPYAWLLRNFPNDIKYFTNRSKSISHKDFVTHILNGTLKGFLVISKLEIDECDQNPVFGFCVQKSPLKAKWIEHIKKSHPDFNLDNNPIVIGMNYFMKPVVLHTSYFLFLYNNFKVKRTFKILHFLEFHHSSYLNKIISQSVAKRAKIKNIISSVIKNDYDEYDKEERLAVLEAHSALLKLKNNGLYGYTMMKSDGYSQQSFVEIKSVRNLNRRKSRTLNMFPINERIMSTTSAPHNIYNINSLTSIGSAILFVSKKIFFNCILFLLYCLDYQLAEMIYWDTDSIMIACVYPTLEENILNEKQNFFNLNKAKYIYINNTSPDCGILVFENISKSIIIFGEKIYQKTTENSEINRAKAIPGQILNQISDDFFTTKPNKISFVSMRADMKGNMGISQNLISFINSYIPRKREFRNNHSVPFQ